MKKYKYFVIDNSTLFESEDNVEFVDEKSFFSYLFYNLSVAIDYDEEPFESYSQKFYSPIELVKYIARHDEFSFEINNFIYVRERV